MICNPQKERRFKLYQLCFSLTTITIPSSITTIGDCAFYKCSSLTTINIPSSITSIGKGVFIGCSKLTQITIPSSVTSIGGCSFPRSSKLKQIAIPSSITSIGENIDEDIHSEEMIFFEELNNIIKIDDATVYMADIPLNKDSYPPSCRINEDFIRDIFQEYDFDKDSVIIKTKIRNCKPCAFQPMTKHEEQSKNGITQNLIMFHFV